MIIFRAVNIYPRQIEDALAQFPEVGSEYQLILNRGDDGKDYMKIRVERCDGVDASRDADLQRKIAQRIRKHIFVSSEIEVVDYGSLPRTDRKSKRLFDHREMGEG